MPTSGPEAFCPWPCARGRGWCQAHSICSWTSSATRFPAWACWWAVRCRGCWGPQAGFADPLAPSLPTWISGSTSPEQGRSVCGKPGRANGSAIGPAAAGWPWRPLAPPRAASWWPASIPVGCPARCASSEMAAGWSSSAGPGAIAGRPAACPWRACSWPSVPGAAANPCRGSSAARASLSCSPWPSVAM